MERGGKTQGNQAANLQKVTAYCEFSAVLTFPWSACVQGEEEGDYDEDADADYNPGQVMYTVIVLAVSRWEFYMIKMLTVTLLRKKVQEKIAQMGWQSVGWE